MPKTIKQLKWRYACKKFDTSKKLSKTKIQRLKQAFNLTATSFGLQPIKMIVVTNKKIKEQLLEHAYFQQQIITCSHLLILTIDTNFDVNSVDEYFKLEKQIRKTPEKTINKFYKELKTSFLNKSKEDLKNIATKQAYIALGNLLTVCAVEKIDSCAMEGFNPDKFDEILNLKSKNLASTLLLPVGYRAKDDFMQNLKKVRKPIKNTIIEL